MLKFHTKPSGQIVKIDLRSVHFLHFIEEIKTPRSKSQERVDRRITIAECWLKIICEEKQIT